jgi:hypothetical protein
MATPPTPSIREVLLSLVHEMEERRQGGNLQQMSLLQAAESRLVPRHGDPTIEQAVLTQWQELFRTGLLAWGHNINNPNPPFFHLTDTGRRALANAARDPSNPAGYLRHLAARASVNPVTMSYLTEALDCYVAGLHKAAAVMVGAAAESIILELRDLVVERLAALRAPKVRALEDWRAFPVTKALTDVFAARIDAKAHRELRERFDMYWSAFAGQIRTVRNDAGHPSSIEPVTADTVHASLLLFPELAALATSLRQWALTDIK